MTTGTLTRNETTRAQCNLPRVRPTLWERIDMAKGTCSIEGCESPVNGNGLCKKHYMRWKRHGDPLAEVRYKGPANVGACSIDGCDSPASTRGWCHTHYTRWRRHGDPLHVEFIVGDDLARLMSKFDQNGPIAKNNPELGRCWTFLGYRNPGGYGCIGVGSDKVMLAHRLAYELLIGPIPEGMELDHFACDGGPDGCGNPYHCRPVMPRENVLRADSVSSRALAATHCPRGHLYDEANTYVASNGGRQCRACAADRKQRYQEVKTPQTHCRNGHLLDDANTYVNPTSGERRCRECKREWERQADTRKARG